MNYFLYVGFYLGLISHEDLINYADRAIVHGATDEWIIELSLSQNVSKQSLLSILNQDSGIVSEDKFNKFHYLLMSFLKGQKNWKYCQAIMVKYYELNKKFLNEMDFEFWTRLKDDYELRMDNLTGCMSMPEELNEYYAGFNNSCIDISFIECIRLTGKSN